MKLSALALSYGLPRRLIEPVKPWAAHRSRYTSDAYFARVQPVVATLVCADRSAASNASAGVRQSRVLRGLVLSASATASRASVLWALRSVPFGKYWRSSPLVFSFVPRCHGLCGSQK